MATIKKVNEMIEFPTDPKNIWKFVRELTKDKDYVPDGVWDISDIDFFDPNMRTWKPTPEQVSTHFDGMKAFIEKYPEFVVAEAYQTEYPLWLAEKPTKQVDYIGSGFNHGSNNIIDNCPKRILICGEDD
jgi:hypothetical protein